MGQKINPLGFRIGISEPWRSRWYAGKKDFRRLLLEDQKIRKYIKKEFYSAAIPRIDIERTREAITVIVYTGRPGVVSFEGAYHGLSLGARDVTWRREFREPFQARLPRASTFARFGDGDDVRREGPQRPGAGREPVRRRRHGPAALPLPLPVLCGRRPTVLPTISA